MKRIDIVKKGDSWVAERKHHTIERSKTKTSAVKKAATSARASSEAVSVRIHKANGRIQEERTYPAKADPRRYKG